MKGSQSAVGSRSVRAKARDTQAGDFCRCFAGFLCALLLSIPVALWIDGQDLSAEELSFSRDRLHFAFSSPVDFGAAENSELTGPESTLTIVQQPPATNVFPTKRQEARSLIEKPNKLTWRSSKKPTRIILQPRGDGLNATAIGHAWSLLPCIADQSCPRAPTELQPLAHASEALPAPAGWGSPKHAQEVARFVTEISLDMLRAGGTGEARLRTRRHSAYRASGAAEESSGRCHALMKPTPTEQLHSILQELGTPGHGPALDRNVSSSLAAAAVATAASFVAFTITDATYGDMLNDVWAGAHRLGLDGRFFYVALDKPTALAACHHRMPAMFFSEPLVLPDSAALPKRPKKFASTKDRVYEAKYGLALALAREKTDFLFFEMDCWMLENPLRAVQNHQVRPRPHPISFRQSKGFRGVVSMWRKSFSIPPSV